LDPLFGQRGLYLFQLEVPDDRFHFLHDRSFPQMKM
jgi:hypothetical protein